MRILEDKHAFFGEGRKRDEQTNAHRQVGRKCEGLKLYFSVFYSLVILKLIEPLLLIQAAGFYCQFTEDAVKLKQDSALERENWVRKPSFTKGCLNMFFPQKRGEGGPD